MISKVTITGRINTWIKYILVTVPGVREVPENNAVAANFPINGDEFAMLIPITAAPYANESQGSRYPE
jgi:hypothetical protein